MTRVSREHLAAGITLGLAIPVAVAYARNLCCGPFADDFGWVRMGLSVIERGMLCVWYDALQTYFFRPFNIALVAQSLKADSWVLAHGVALGIHAVIALTVGFLASRLLRDSRSRWLGVAAACAFFAHQANTTAVLQIDTLSQIICDLFSVLALVAAYYYATRSRRWVVVSALASLLAMLGKEGGVAAPLAAVVTVLFLSPPAIRIRKSVPMLVAQLGAMCIYIVWRLNLQNLVAVPEAGEARYGLAVGWSTLRNLAQFVFVQVVPWNSASLMAGGRTYEWLGGMAIGGLVILMAALGWRRLIRRRPELRPLLALLIFIFIIWCTPYIFLKRVSEQEVYRLTAVTVLLASVGCWAMVRWAGRRTALLAAAVWCLWVSVGSVGSIEKAGLLRHNAGVCCRLLDEMEAALGDVSEIDCVHVLIVHPDHPPRTYSILCIPETHLRAKALRYLDTRLRKPGIEIEYHVSGEEPSELRPLPPKHKMLRVDVASASVEPVSR